MNISSFAQDIQSNPGAYMTEIGKARGDMDTKYMQYVSAAAHGRRARKVEKLRQQVLDNITDCRYKTIELPKYKGDNSLRQASIDYILFCYRVFNEDYKKIVDMEELAEQSFDEMQAYILLHEMVSQKLHEASTNLQKAETEFAAKYNVNLVDNKNPLSEKMEIAGNLNHYINGVYLVFFKCNWEDNQMVTAMNNKKLNDIEQSRNALAKYANDGFKTLDTMRVFEGDPSLANACRQTLTFYKNLAEKDMATLSDFYLKQDEFEKAKKAFDAKSGNATKQDVNDYNKAVKEMNNAVNAFNQTNNKVNNNRKQILNDWDNAEKKFADQHMPYYR
ncbi:MAG TPA: hypothetical protein VFV08_14880 [Puia sp.]|nr:hypothetical protein [Puia sp.]